MIMFCAVCSVIVQ